MGSRFRDLTGRTFGFIFVVDRAGSNKRNQATFNGICHAKNCGKKIVVAGYRLTSKKQPMTHCGCLTVNDLSGLTFGFITVIDRAGSNKQGKTTFNGICHAENCGKKIVVVGSELTAKKHPKIHCGCLTSQHHSDANKGVLHPNYKHGLSKTTEYLCEQDHRRRVKKQKNNAGVNLSYAESLEMSRPKLDYCVYCGSTDNLSTDHIIPIDKGGNQDYKNLIRACSSCNSAKNASFFIDWYIKSKRCTRSLTEIIIDMGFDSIFSLQHYQNDMSPKYAEENIATTVTKLLRAKKKSIRLLDRYYRSLDHYPTH